MNRTLLLLGIVALLTLDACDDVEIGKAKDVNPETVYFDYLVSSGESNEYVTVKAQYRFAGPNGTTLLLEDPAKVLLDGQPLKMDSSSFSGVYYELMLPKSGFIGKHEIAFTDMSGKEFREEFEFDTLFIAGGLSDTVGRKDIEVELKGITADDLLQVVVTDTVASRDGIQRIDTIKDGRLRISVEDLAEFSPGPLFLDLSKESSRPVKNGTKEGGTITITYHLLRELELRR